MCVMYLDDDNNDDDEDRGWPYNLIYFKLHILIVYALIKN